MRVVDADELLRRIQKDAYTAQTDYAEGLRDMIDDINRAKTIDAVPVVHGREIAAKITMLIADLKKSIDARAVRGKPCFSEELVILRLKDILTTIGGNVDNAEHCVACGDTIPEGRQVCPTCEKEVDSHG